MGRCSACRTQTQHFCFVHQQFVCDRCLVTRGNIHGWCFISTYRNWVQDSAYSWPPRCAKCNVKLEADGDNIRRVCLHVEHASCVERSKPPEYACDTCNAPLQLSFDNSGLGQGVIDRVRKMPALRSLVPDPHTQVERQNTDSNVRPNFPESTATGFERQGAALQVEETEIGTSVSRVAVSEDQERKQRASEENTKAASAASIPRVQTGSVKVPRPVSPNTALETDDSISKRATSDTRLDVGVLPSMNQRTNMSSSIKRDRSNLRTFSTPWRKTLKAAMRRLFDVRKKLMENRDRAIVASLFVVCIILVIYLSSGDDDTNAVSRNVVEDVSLPHIRVNPAFVRSHGNGHALGSKPGRS